MTIPSRPAPPPPPPVVTPHNATTTTTTTTTTVRTERLHQSQLQNTLQLFNGNEGVEKLRIKLPPPPTNSQSGGVGGIRRSASNSNNSNRNNINICTSSSSGSITRKFPPANIRYSPATNWDDSPFEVNQINGGNIKKIPPPRPPPPKVVLTDMNRGKIGRGRQQGQSIPTAPPPHQQSINILTNIFNRKKNSGILPHKKITQKNSRNVAAAASNQISFPSSNTNMNGNSNYFSSHNHTSYGSSNAMTKTSSLSSITQLSLSSSSFGQFDPPQLISFDSPPNSPTFAQKSNSDCVSVDSFSSDSNFSSPNNGNTSQTESGFEDDFLTASRTTSPLDPWENLSAFTAADSNFYENNITANSIGTVPVRNLSTINTKIQNSNDNLLCNGKSLLPPLQSLTMPTIIKPKISQKPQAPKPPASSAAAAATTTSFFGAGGRFNSNYNYIRKDGDEDEENIQPGTPPSPPMPKCPPPPPPSLTTTTTTMNEFSMLDVINGKIDILSLDTEYDNSIPFDVEPYGIALYDFDGPVDGDLSFRENEKIYILEEVNEDWLRGRTRSGCEGIFPTNYIEIKVPLAEYQRAAAHRS